MATIKTRIKQEIATPAFPGAKLMAVELRHHEALATLFAQFIDAATVAAVPKTEAGVKALQKSIVTGTERAARARATKAGALAADATSDDVWAGSPVARKTVVEYAQGVARAYVHGVRWTPTLKNDPAYALPWGRAAANNGPAPEPVAASAGATVVKCDRKAARITVATTPATVDETQQIAAAIFTDPARVALALAYCRAQGWIK